MTRNALSTAGLALAGLLASLTTSAATSTFDFENLPIPTETPFSATSGGITARFAGPTLEDPGAFGIASNYRSPTGFQYRLMSGDFLTVGSAFGAPGSALTVTFSSAVSGFSVDFGLDDPGHTTTLSFTTSAGGAGAGAGALTSGFLYPEGTLNFAGSPFDAIILRSTAIDFQIDNLAVAAAVPEPSVTGLLAAGLGITAAFVRRNRRAA